MADQAMSDGIRALVERSADLANQVSANDQHLNVLRFAIEENCYNLIATQQPNATDLRILVSIVSVATNLERIGDYAAGVARLAARMVDHPLPKPLVDIPQMGEIGREMVKGAVAAFMARDTALAESIMRRDDDMNRLQEHAYRELVSYMTSSPTLVERCTLMMYISHNLERIGDRATNICERAIFVATGQLKEHRSRYPG